MRALAPVVYRTLSIEEKISVAFPDAPIMLQVARAESRLVPSARNPTSSAKGLFQVLDSTWVLYGCLGDVLNEDDNIACARKIYDDSGLFPWNESRYAWSGSL